METKNRKMIGTLEKKLNECMEMAGKIWSISDEEIHGEKDIYDQIRNVLENIETLKEEKD